MVSLDTPSASLIFLSLSLLPTNQATYPFPPTFSIPFFTPLGNLSYLVTLRPMVLGQPRYVVTYVTAGPVLGELSSIRRPEE